MSKILDICLTGGPCAGKSTTLELLKEEKSIEGCRLLFVPEAATLLGTNGMRPDDNEFLWQECIFKTQLHFMRMYREYAEELDEDCLIIHDRGIHDALAYIDPTFFIKMCLKYNFDDGIYTYYDCVIHLVSTAKDRPELYRLNNKNNKVRREKDIEYAIESEDKTLWLTELCNNHYIVDNDTDNFMDKYNKVIEIIRGQIIRENNNNDNKNM